ncbi:phosphate regulon transcriptional regulator PhoB [Wohlfahrtiimonas chitiniclastica]|uniref:phosphate regulon transcriptional regulator PhoB n=1 Tax=Wohlfahrtiimonas chitiniclastica TaxID=400946 RepID=UPI001BCD0ABD|nr:phosphate regulon transcriptional regulator PhoB [Wohlfahrtiimonas chitiniclastica]MBS7816955.1 phosphate regulon transcriptional regulator PhoB [Wohlfahrtiimonas chitiniclastica]MBS7822841.1 phosphate regulon transcriptional regulator PhoB [Wohlfahrtiimonas chitiniclastica]MBS7830655.1 phosphate regulon transcriptional regulator PhoB [Wohlfahrtiimonas chitiniclastica]MBS7832517.1 phosphate regulon transcriptional regulator PhoB [Wohlfahrtiimonas chitiniclastica]
MQKIILIVEDDDALRQMLVMLMQSSGFAVLEARDQPTALAVLNAQTVHLALIDWMIPGGSGISLIKQLRKDENLKYIPVIMLTAKTAEDDQVQGFDVGADDYVTKPFSNKQLLVRIKALLRRIYPEDQPRLMINNLAIDEASHRVFIDDQEVELGPTEYKLLSFLMQRAERVFSRDQLIDHIWGNDVYIDDRTVDVHIGRLRKQLEKGGVAKMIQTVRGAGYRLSAQVKE